MASRRDRYQLHRDLSAVNRLTQRAADGPESDDSHPHAHSFSTELQAQ
jgi:hypothetical protein